MDASGNVYVSGITDSIDFPTASPLQGTYGGGGNDVFVAKLNAAGSALVYSTYLGGSGNKQAGVGIAVDALGNAYVFGSTNSPDFPTTAGALQTSYGGGANDTFIAKLNAAGSALIFSTYLGGSGPDGGGGILQWIPWVIPMSLVLLLRPILPSSIHSRRFTGAAPMMLL